MHTKYISIALSILFLIIALFLILSQIYFGNSINISSQEIVDSIQVSMRLTSPKGGFLVISEIVRGNKDANWLLVAQTKYLAPGVYTNVRVPILPDAEVSPEKLDRSPLIGQLFEDANGNTIMDDTAKDKQFRTIWGKPIQVIFQNTAPPPQSQ